MHPLTPKDPPSQELRVPIALVALRAEVAKPAAVSPLELRAAPDVAAVSVAAYVAGLNSELASGNVSKQLSHPQHPTLVEIVLRVAIKDATLNVPRSEKPVAG